MTTVKKFSGFSKDFEKSKGYTMEGKCPSVVLLRRVIIVNTAGMRFRKSAGADELYGYQ